MNIIDALIIVGLIIGVLAGFRRGLIKEVVLLVGLILAVIISYYLKNPVSAFLYNNLPFFKFSGIFSGVKILNILVYEVIAFLIVFSISYLLLRLLLKISSLIEKILRITIILGFFSKIGGSIIGFIEAFIIIFICLFIIKQPFINIEGVNESRYADRILENTPILSSAVEDSTNVINEIYDLAKTYKNNDNFNEEAIDLFIKYDIIKEENINLLKKKGKL